MVEANETKLKTLETEELLFRANDSLRSNASATPEELKRLLNRTMAPDVLPLRVGAQVMLVKVFFHPNPFATI